MEIVRAYTDKQKGRLKDKKKDAKTLRILIFDDRYKSYHQAYFNMAQSLLL